MVMTYIDKFNKIVQLAPLQESDAHTVDDKLLSLVVSQHGLPECIMSDHDPHFYSHFWEDLTCLLYTTLTFSMASHPQINGMAEVTNHAME